LSSILSAALVSACLPPEFGLEPPDADLTDAQADAPPDAGPDLALLPDGLDASIGADTGPGGNPDTGGPAIDSPGVPLEAAVDTAGPSADRSMPERDAAEPGRDAPPSHDSCVPTCVGKTCGASDGCNGQCSQGTCTPPNTCGGGGMVNVCGCTPNCQGKYCGASDGCNGQCSEGACTPPSTCGGGGTRNVCGCTPNCPAGVCQTPDGCGGTCMCPIGLLCVANMCLLN
jgi:hypothetical protein